ncbi:hypothetical protein [Sphingomonas sp. PP-CE-3G-477]|uniref:hypothetical protein n=1 Tax=Sphingomonas sp. PP-CE-3G-477 TaxID=2135660 RepID=UPI0011B20A2D|nr:hypothetical protein [Sphingomonas sp. PP-CE-3G-477]
MIGIRYPSPRIYEVMLPSLNIVNGQPEFLAPPSPLTSQHVCSEQNAKREAGKDQLAQDFNSATKILYSDTNEREYAAALIMNVGDGIHYSFRLSTITAGMTWAEASHAGLPAPEVRFQIGALGLGDYVVGVIHIHPPRGDPNPDLNKLPSNNDWQVYNAIKATGAHMAPEYAYSSYIVGPDGTIREYRQDAGFPSRATSGINNRC